METIENVELHNSHEEVDTNQVIVNTELGAFGDNKVLDFIRTPWDHMVDDLSVNSGKQM